MNPEWEIAQAPVVRINDDEMLWHSPKRCKIKKESNRRLSMSSTITSTSCSSYGKSLYDTQSETFELTKTPVIRKTDIVKKNAKCAIMNEIQNQETELANNRRHLKRNAGIALIRYKSGNLIGAVISMKQIKIIQATQGHLRITISELRQLFQSVEFDEIQPESTPLRIANILEKPQVSLPCYHDKDLLREVRSGRVEALLMAL